MFSNYLKIAWRNLVNNKVSGSINILGLAAGMAVALIITLWINYEYAYDKFLPQYEQVYRVRRNFNNNGDILTFGQGSLKLADVLRSDIPEIEYLSETDWMGPHGLKVGDKKFYIDGAQAGSDFLKIFQYPLLQGEKEEVLKDPFSIVLTESMATRLFGQEDPMGKMVRIDNQHDVKVTGILKDLPRNTSFWFNYILPFSYYESTNADVKSARKKGFSENAYQIFVKLKAGTSFEKVDAKIKNIQKREDKNLPEVFLQPLKNWHLYDRYVNGIETAGYLEFVRLFALIGVLVLLIACINFINLTTARSEKRAKEVGIRKAVGSQKKQLVLQFLMESFLITTIAAVFCVLLVLLCLPFFNRLTGSGIRIPFVSPVFWLGMMGCVLITSLLAGTRPAFVLSSFNPVTVLKGGLTGSRFAALPRKVLVVTQFSCSVALIISTIVIYQQIQHAKDRPVGYEMDRLMTTEMNADLQKNYVPLKNELLQRGLVTSMSDASTPATLLNWHSNPNAWEGQLPGETFQLGMINAGGDYFKTLGMQMASGRDFKGNYDVDSADVVVNEAAVKRFRWKEPLNQSIGIMGKSFRVVGVVKDVLMESPYAAAEPTMFMFESSPSNYLFYRIPAGSNTHTTVAALTTVFSKYSIAFPYEYSFVNANYDQKFRQEVLIGKLAGIFAVLAILISCLGLFGLAVYMAQQRTKEIGIRKVLGASISQVWLLLSKDFLLLVFISCMIATPLALFFLQHWLLQYEYRIVLGPAVFIIAALLAIAVTLLTTSFQAIRAALVNPVKSLRSE